MAKPKTISTEELVRLYNEYFVENPGARFKIPAFGDYVRENGFDVQDYTIRRDKEFRKYVEETEQKSDEKAYTEHVVYKNMDVDEFLSKNNTTSKLKEALLKKDEYYSNIAASAAIAFRKKQAAEEKMNELNKQLTELKEKHEKNDAKELRAQIKKQTEIIKKLREIIEEYIYRDAANAILQKEGILEIISTIIPEEIMEEKTISADTDVSKYSSVNELLDGFEDE